MTIEDIVWPCDLPNELKEQLLNIAVPCQGIKALPFTLSYCSVPGVYYVVKGSCGLCFTTNDTKSVLGAVVGAKDWFGALNMGTGRKIFGVAEELEDIHFLMFPEAKVLKLAEREPLVYKWLFNAGVHAQSFIMQAMISAIHQKEQKVMYVLLELHSRQSQSGTTINASQAQLSSITGLSRPRLNEVLKGFEKQGLIEVQRNKVLIKDIEALSKLLSPMNLMMKNPTKS
nr:Crp/Fnr family transcriptional regulator [Vibrio superstes]